MELHNYFNSSTSFRVRIALALKGISYQHLAVNLRAQEQHSLEHLKLNPSAGVPVLVDGGFSLTQSIAIIDYLDGQYPQPQLIPKNAWERARVMELALGIACDIHPVNNMRVLKYLQSELGVSDTQKQAWYAHWILEGLGATEELLHRYGSGPCCFGSQPTLADCCLIPQVTNALRMGCELKEFSRIMGIFEHCMGLPEFQDAAPSNQPDFAR